MIPDYLLYLAGEIAVLAIEFIALALVVIGAMWLLRWWRARRRKAARRRARK